MTTEDVAATKGPKLSRQAKIDALFVGKKFQVLKEIHLEGDQQFQTPLGSPGQHGFVLREVGNPDNVFPVGATLLKKAHESYDAIVDYDKVAAAAKTTKAELRKKQLAAKKAAQDPSVNVPLPSAEPLINDEPTSEQVTPPTPAVSGLPLFSETPPQI